MQSKKLGRAAAAAGLMVLIAPTVAAASWWDGGYDGRYDNGYSARSGSSTKKSPGSKCREQSDCAPAPAPECGKRSECASPPASQCEQQPDCTPPPPPPQCGPPACGPAPLPPPPPVLVVEPIYGCENSDLPGTHPRLHKTTTPPPGTPVRPGDEILVDIAWEVRDWVTPDLHKAIDCVYINGRLVPELSGGERPTPNDGHFAFRYFVPLDVPPGSEICDQGFVSGPNGHDDYGRAVSNVVCFPVELPPPPPPPCCVPPVEETTTTTTTTTTPTTAPEQDEPYSQRVSQERPPPAVLPGPRDVLPRTGSGPGPARLAAGALALAALAGRRRWTGRP